MALVEMSASPFPSRQFYPTLSWCHWRDGHIRFFPVDYTGWQDTSNSLQTEVAPLHAFILNWSNMKLIAMLEVKHNHITLSACTFITPYYSLPNVHTMICHSKCIFISGLVIHNNNRLISSNTLPLKSCIISY